MENLYTTKEIADALHLSIQGAIALCRRMRVKKYGRDYIVTESELKKMRKRRGRGRPKLGG